jgi:hypothetical protein
MRNAILSLLVFLGAGFAATEVKLVDVEGGAVPVMRPKVETPVFLDTSEADTSTRYFTTATAPILYWSDTLGQVFMRCDDSAGTDSVGGSLKWQGNPTANLTALWENIDSVAIAVASGVETQTSKAVVNSKRYQAIRFILRNQLAPGGSAAEKTVCRDIVLSRHKRIRY